MFTFQTVLPCVKTVEMLLPCSEILAMCPYLYPSSYVAYHSRDQSTVTFPIGDYVNILHDYKKTGPSKILKFLTCCCHHLIDMLVEFYQNHIFLTLKMAEHDIPVNVYQFLHELLCTLTLVAKKLQKILPPIKIISKSTVTLLTCSTSKTCQCVCSKALMSDDMNF